MRYCPHFDLTWPCYGPMTPAALSYAVWEKESLAYAPDYYTIENDYDDDLHI